MDEASSSSDSDSLYMYSSIPVFHLIGIIFGWLELYQRKVPEPGRLKRQQFKFKHSKSPDFMERSAALKADRLPWGRLAINLK
jgi:hypothetical protein